VPYITWTSKFSIFMAWRLRDLARLSSAFTYLLLRLTAWSQSAITSSKFLKKQTGNKFKNTSKDAEIILDKHVCQGNTYKLGKVLGSGGIFYLCIR
jgi:hypothetical protein